MTQEICTTIEKWLSLTTETDEFEKKLRKTLKEEEAAIHDVLDDLTENIHGFFPKQEFDQEDIHKRFDKKKVKGCDIASPRHKAIGREMKKFDRALRKG